MTHDEPPGTSFVPTYRSGTAARLAGIPVATLPFGALREMRDAAGAASRGASPPRSTDRCERPEPRSWAKR